MIVLHRCSLNFDELINDLSLSLKAMLRELSFHIWERSWQQQNNLLQLKTCALEPGNADNVLKEKKNITEGPMNS